MSTHFIQTENSSYGRTLPLIPQNIPPPEHHIYATPTSYGIPLRTETSSFSPNADVLPRIGTLKKNNRYIDVKLDPNTSSPIPVAVPNPEREKEEFYEKVYDDDDSFDDVEEMYDKGPMGQLEHTMIQAFDSNLKLLDSHYGPESQEVARSSGSQNDSGSSVNTSLTKVGEDFRTLETFTGKTAPSKQDQRDSAEVAHNPLYDKLKHGHIVVM